MQKLGYFRDLDKNWDIQENLKSKHMFGHLNAKSNHFLLILKQNILSFIQSDPFFILNIGFFLGQPQHQDFSLNVSVFTKSLNYPVFHKVNIMKRNKLRFSILALEICFDRFQSFAHLICSPIHGVIVNINVHIRKTS